MKKIFKSLDKKYLAVFLPLTAITYCMHGVTPMWTISTVAGLGFIAWQIYDAQ